MSREILILLLLILAVTPVFVVARYLWLSPRWADNHHLWRLACAGPVATGALIMAGLGIGISRGEDPLGLLPVLLGLLAAMPVVYLAPKWLYRKFPLGPKG